MDKLIKIAENAGEKLAGIMKIKLRREADAVYSVVRDGETIKSFGLSTEVSPSVAMIIAGLSGIALLAALLSKRSKS